MVKNRLVLGAALGALCLLALGLLSSTGPRPADAGPSSGPTLRSRNVTVKAVAAKPNDFLGQVTIVGVVGAVTRGQGFVLIDSREFRECGLSCLTERGTPRIPVRWSGPPPKVAAEVLVDGLLTKGASGFEFQAQKVGPK